MALAWVFKIKNLPKNTQNYTKLKLELVKKRRNADLSSA
jgi:hypothetical protein